MSATKTKVMSLMTIERISTAGVAATKDSPARPPVTESIAPFTLFMATAAEVKDLASHDAITDDKDRFHEAKVDLSVFDDLGNDDGDSEAEAKARKAAEDAEKARTAAATEAAKKGSQKPAKDLI